MKWPQTKINDCMSRRYIRDLKMKQTISPCLCARRPTRPTAIPSFHLDISSLPLESTSRVRCHRADVIREIHFSYEVVFPVVIIGRVVVDSQRFVSYGWQQMELRRWEASFHGSPASRSSFLLPLLPSFSFVAALYENEKATSYQIELPPSRLLRSSLFRPRPVCSLLRALSGLFYLDVVLGPLPAAHRCTLS